MPGNDHRKKDSHFRSVGNTLPPSLSFSLSLSLSLSPSPSLSLSLCTFTSRNEQKKKRKMKSRGRWWHTTFKDVGFFQAGPRDPHLDSPPPPTGHAMVLKLAPTCSQWCNKVNLCEKEGGGMRGQKVRLFYFAYTPDAKKKKTFLTMGFVGVVIWVLSRNCFCSCSPLFFSKEPSPFSLSQYVAFWYISVV